MLFRSPLEAIYADLNNLIQDIETNRPGKANTEDQRVFESLMKDLWKLDPAAAKGINPAGTGLRHPKATVAASAVDLNNIIGSTDKALTSQIATNTGKSVTELQAIKAILSGRKDVGSGTGTRNDAYVVSGSQYSTGQNMKNGNLTEIGKRKVIADNKLVKGEYFEYQGQLYRVDVGYDAKLSLGKSNAVRIEKAAGGYISGPGTATSDSIPAMLSNGEYVVNAASRSEEHTSELQSH